jgi:hypothetical protein
VLLSAFGVALLIPRAHFVTALAAQGDRTSILEPSYFDAAREIRQRDPQAFVLFEPKVSSDVYLGNQALFGLRTVPTRHITVQRTDKSDALSLLWYYNAHDDTIFDLRGSDFISADDIPHLWFLGAKKDSAVSDAGRPGGRSTYNWQATSLAHTDEPRILFFARNYTPFYEQRQRETGKPDRGWFSYVNGGMSMMLMPPSSDERHIQLLVAPTQKGDFASLVLAIEAWQREQGWPPRSFSSWSTNTWAVELTLAPTNAPLLVPLIDIRDEYFLNVRLNGLELPSSDTRIQVSGETLVPGAMVVASWEKLAPPARTDWVGIFPENGVDADRVVFAETGGASSGSIRLVLPPTTKPGRYEARLFSQGTWRQAAVSPPFVVQPVGAAVGVEPAVVRAGASLLVSWRDLPAAEPDDWVGLFPTHGDDQTRVTFTPTGGGREGSVYLTIPPSTTDGDYDIRLFSHGTWQEIGHASVHVGT